MKIIGASTAGILFFLMAVCRWAQSVGAPLELPRKVMSADKLDEAIEKAKETGKLLSLLFYDPNVRGRNASSTLALLDLVDGFSVVVAIERKDIHKLSESLRVGLHSNLIGARPPAVAVYSSDGNEHVASISAQTIKAMGDVAERDFKRDVRNYREKKNSSGETSLD